MNVHLDWIAIVRILMWYKIISMLNLHERGLLDGCICYLSSHAGNCDDVWHGLPPGVPRARVPAAGPASVWSERSLCEEPARGAASRTPPVHVPLRLSD